MVELFLSRRRRFFRPPCSPNSPGKMSRSRDEDSRTLGTRAEISRRADGARCAALLSPLCDRALVGDIPGC
jgi:hypothetical protein